MAQSKTATRVPVECEELADSGFKFDLAARNLALDKVGVHPPKAISTGTTIVAAMFKNGVVMGADSRATSGNIVADKYCIKIHRITDQIYACGAGTAADLDKVCDMIAAQMNLYELNNGNRRAYVSYALAIAKQHLFKYQGHVSAYLLIGGVDSEGPHLYNVAAHGSSDNLPYGADGSGSYAAISVLEKGFKFGMTEQECIQLVSRALESGMHGDNMSGNTYRLTIVTSDGAHRNVEPFTPEFSKKPEPNDLSYKFKKGATKVLKEKRIEYEIVEEKMEH